GWYPKHGTTVMYEEGKLITAGGAIAGGNTASTNRVMLIDLNGPAPVVRETNPMANARKFQNGVMLPNGELLVLGGNTSGRKFNDSGTIYVPEIWNPQTESWRVGAPSAVPRNYHSIGLLLTDGRVLSAGGGLCGCAADHQDGQIYSPPYLFNADGSVATRPVISGAPQQIGAGTQFNVTATPGLTHFSFIKLSATTHGVNTDLRYLGLDFTEVESGDYWIDAHDNINVLTPGYWMLFGLNAQGTPSVSRVIHVSSELSNTGPIGVNLAAGKPVSSSSDQSSDLGPENAVDANTGTRWSSQYSDPQWIEIDLGNRYSIERVRLNWEVAYARSYTIEVSDDGSNWTTIYSTSNGDGGIDNLTGLTGAGRYIRLYGTQRGTGFGYSLWEFEVYGSLYDFEISGSDTQPEVNGDSITYTANVSGGIGEITYEWNFGDGTAPVTVVGNSEITHQFAGPGRYLVTVVATDAAGNAIEYTYYQVIHAPLDNGSLAWSSSVIVGGGEIWNANPDNGSVSVIDENSLNRIAEVSLSGRPHTLARTNNGDVWVAQSNPARIAIIDSGNYSVEYINLPDNSAPFGIVFDSAQNRALVTLAQLGELHVYNANNRNR
ncbi:MAG: discoidin domain-containing protein, partial [Pseudomonadota bacterium]